MDRQTSLIVITGPSCSGKTSLAMELSRIFPIEVISADSMQVYRYMDVATAKPTLEEQGMLPHHLIDVVNPDQEFNAGMFEQQAQEMIPLIRERGKLPIIVGGTGLYVKALIYGLVPAPPRSPRIRTTLTILASKKGIGFLKAFLDRLDPESGKKIQKHDSVRIIRYLEIILLTGTKPSTFFSRHRFRIPRFSARIASIVPGREDLYHAINERVFLMVEKGLMEETARLLSLGYHPKLKSMQAFAYRHSVSCLEGRLSLNEAISLIQRDTRHYAKRQMTWLKANTPHEHFNSARNALRTLSEWIDLSLKKGG